jgi:phosphohistidine phosphatase SixA
MEVMAMFRRWLILLLCCLSVGQASSAGQTTEEVLWDALKGGGYIVLLRHAVTEPGIGDPPGFSVGDCSTQRNLSAQGRADAQLIGAAFRSHHIPIPDVLSSRWCRCIDTAQLAFGRVKPVPMLDSMFNDPDSARQEKARALFASLSRRSGAGNLILVTHAQNIQELTGVSPSSGEMVVVTLDGPRRFKVIGRLDVPGR